MSNQKQKKSFVKKSNKDSLTPELLELVRINGGSVTYFRKVEKYDTKTGKIILLRQPILTSKLNHQLLFNSKGESTTFKHVIEVLTTTSVSLGADYFTVQI